MAFQLGQTSGALFGISPVFQWPKPVPSLGSLTVPPKKRKDKAC